MTEYIKREELMEFPIRRNHYDRKNGNKHFINGIETVLEYAENLPAADVAPVVHGEWEAVDWREYDANSCEVIVNPKDGIACTHCRYVFKKDALWKKNFCPNCGTRMYGGNCDAAD